MGPLSAADELLQAGAVVEVTIANPAAGGGTPVTLRAMIDTGASISTVVISVAERAGLQQTGSTQLSGVGGIQTSAIYAASLAIPQFGVVIPAVEVASIPNPLPDVEMLIGRDVLRNVRSITDGPVAFCIDDVMRRRRPAEYPPGLRAPCQQKRNPRCRSSWAAWPRRASLRPASSPSRRSDMEHGGCPSGHPGTPGSPGAKKPDEKIRTMSIAVVSINLEGVKEVRDQVERILYVDRSRDELGIRTMDGDRVFVRLSDVVALLGRQ